MECSQSFANLEGVLNFWNVTVTIETAEILKCSKHYETLQKCYRLGHNCFLIFEVSKWPPKLWKKQKMWKIKKKVKLHIDTCIVRFFFLIIFIFLHILATLFLDFDWTNIYGVCHYVNRHVKRHGNTNLCITWVRLNLK